MQLNFTFRRWSFSIFFTFENREKWKKACLIIYILFCWSHFSLMRSCYHATILLYSIILFNRSVTLKSCKRQLVWPQWPTLMVVHVRLICSWRRENCLWPCQIRIQFTQIPLEFIFIVLQNLIWQKAIQVIYFDHLINDMLFNCFKNLIAVKR